MAPAEPLVLESFLDDTGGPTRSLVTVDRTESDPVQRLFSSAFEGQPVTVEKLSVLDHAEDVVLLVEGGRSTGDPRSMP